MTQQETKASGKAIPTRAGRRLHRTKQSKCDSRSFFWLDDLSAPDPLFILPVLFGLVMVLTQRLNPQPPNMDPTQAQVMKVMPVMLSVFFVVFPSSLALYSVVNAGISLGQQKYLYAKYGGSN